MTHPYGPHRPTDAPAHVTVGHGRGEREQQDGPR